MQGVAAGAKACAAVLFCKNFREMRIPARFSLDRGNELLYNMSCSDEVDGTRLHAVVAELADALL